MHDYQFVSNQPGAGVRKFGIFIAFPLSFIVFLVTTAVATFRQGVHAGAIIALVGVIILMIGSWMVGEAAFGEAIIELILGLAFPIATLAWSNGAHGFVWLWIIFWMALVHAVLRFLYWVANY